MFLLSGWWAISMVIGIAATIGVLIFLTIVVPRKDPQK
jgi:hypothetical protein